MVDNFGTLLHSLLSANNALTMVLFGVLLATKQVDIVVHKQKIVQGLVLVQLITNCLSFSICCVPIILDVLLTDN